MSGSAERSSGPEQVQRKIVDMVTSVAGKHNLPREVHAIISDDETGKRYSAIVEVDWVSEGAANIAIRAGGELRSDLSALEMADIILEEKPGLPIVCDNKIAEEFSGNPLTWLEEDHYRLEGRSKGVLEVYLPYKTAPAIELETETKRITGEVYTE